MYVDGEAPPQEAGYVSINERPQFAAKWSSNRAVVDRGHLGIISILDTGRVETIIQEPSLWPT
jgi:hypothetical protein